MRRWSVLLVIAAVFLGACNDEGSGGAEDPKAQLVAAFEALGQVDAQSITLSLASDPGSLATVSEGAVTEEQADVILNSSITIEGNKADDPADQAARVTVNVEGTDGVEIVIVGTDVYVRTDIQGFADAFGLDDSGLRDLAASAEAQGLSFVQPLLEGEFVKFTGADQLTGGAGGQAGGMTEQQRQLLDRFGEAIEQDATVTSEGSDDVGDQHVASIALRDLYQKVLDLSSEAGQTLPPGMVPPAEEIPEGDLSLDVWVADGRVVQIEFDITQIGEFAAADGGENPFEGVEQLALRMVLSDEVGEISAPDAAAEVSAEEIQNLIGSFIFGTPGGVPGGGGTDVPGGGGGGGGGDTGFDCSIYEDLPPETFDGLPQETLDQLEQLCPGVVPSN